MLIQVDMNFIEPLMALSRGYHLTSDIIGYLLNSSQYLVIGNMANSILLVTGGRKEQMLGIFAGKQLETSVAVHSSYCSLRSFEK